MPRASKFGDELKKVMDVDIEYIAGSGGVFDVSIDGKLIFSKWEKGRFPNLDEIIKSIKSI